MSGKTLKQRLKKWRSVLIVVAIVAIGVAILFFLPDEDAPKPVPQITTNPDPSTDPNPAPTVAPDEGDVIESPPPFFDEEDDREVEKEFKDPFEEKDDRKTE